VLAIGAFVVGGLIAIECWQAFASRGRKAAFFGWSLMADGAQPTLDLDRDGTVDVRRIKADLCELRTSDGWVPFHLTETAFLRPRWERMKSGSRVVLVISADDGNRYRFDAATSGFNKDSLWRWPFRASLGL
jgi:hypothetical protein